MKKLFCKVVSTLCFLFLIISVEAQVKTKIFFNEIPKSKLGIYLDNIVEKNIPAPAIFSKLLMSGFSDTVNNKEYKNKFALPVKVDIDFISTANRNEVGDEIIYSLTLNAENALNITCQFEKFKLSKNAVLSIFTSYEITDSITAKENNQNNIWATRVYQGNRMNLVLKIPNSEVNQTMLQIS